MKMSCSYRDISVVCDLGLQQDHCPGVIFAVLSGGGGVGDRAWVGVAATAGHARRRWRRALGQRQRVQRRAMWASTELLRITPLSSDNSPSTPISMFL